MAPGAVSLHGLGTGVLVEIFVPLQLDARGDGSEDSFEGGVEGTYRGVEGAEGCESHVVSCYPVVRGFFKGEYRGSHSRLSSAI